MLHSRAHAASPRPLARTHDTNTKRNRNRFPGWGQLSLFSPQPPIYWAHLGHNFTQVGSNWSRLGSNWLPIWTPFGPQVIPLAPLGPHWELDRFGDRFGNLASSQVRCLRIRSAFLELTGRTTGTTGANEVVARGGGSGSTSHTRWGPG